MDDHYQKSLWEKLQDGDVLSGDTNQESLKDFVSFLKKYLSVADYIPLSTLFSQIFNEKKDFFIKKYGYEALEIYEHIYQTIITLETKHSFTLQDLVYYLNKNDINIKKDTSSKNFSQVRLMTIHGSKGLESPIVILADANIQTTLQKETLIKTEERVFIKPSDKDCPKAFKQNKLDSLEELKSEEQRLLYVAMTRARDHLYIFGKGTLIEDSWYSKLSKVVNHKAEPILKEKDTNDKDIKDTANVPLYFMENVDEKKFIQPNFLTTTEIERGILIHKLFEDLAIQTDKETYAKDFILKHQDHLLEKDLDKILFFIRNQEFSYIFTEKGFSEVSISYQGHLYRIDRLLQTEEKLIILDFKTGKRTTKSQESYKQQMNFYKKAIQEIYPHHVVECHIVWFDALQIEKIDINFHQNENINK
jgi:ATP-dependent helicase/nuclease subunit A